MPRATYDLLVFDSILGTNPAAAADRYRRVLAGATIWRETEPVTRFLDDLRAHYPSLDERRSPRLRAVLLAPLTFSSGGACVVVRIHESDEQLAGLIERIAGDHWLGTFSVPEAWLSVHPHLFAGLWDPELEDRQLRELAAWAGISLDRADGLGIMLRPPAPTGLITAIPGLPKRLEGLLACSDGLKVGNLTLCDVSRISPVADSSGDWLRIGWDAAVDRVLAIRADAVEPHHLLWTDDVLTASSAARDLMTLVRDRAVGDLTSEQ